MHFKEKGPHHIILEAVVQPITQSMYGLWIK